MPGLIAIVGRPNVGKSALFNRIVGKRIAIVHDEPGVTRDRLSAEAEWRGQRFSLVDTGGIGLLRGEKAVDPIAAEALKQVEIAIASADEIIFVVNAQEGVVPLDREVAERLRVSGKPVIVAVNKVDNDRIQDTAAEFAELGFDSLFPVSAIHGHGVGALMDAALALLRQLKPSESSAALPRETEEEPKSGRPLKLAIVGRPNVGKSSLINSLTQSERVLVSPIPGTTRDAVDVPLTVVSEEGAQEEYLLIDTAGIRQERRIDDSVEFYSVKRTEASIERCDIAVFVVDAEAGVTAQDKKVAGKIAEARKACVIVVNKWDLVAEDVAKARREAGGQRRLRKRSGNSNSDRAVTLAEFAKWVQRQLFFLDYAPVIFASAKSTFNLERLLEAVRFVAAQMQQKVPTALLNRALHRAIEERQPVSAQGRRLKFFYATQVRQAPPTFLLFVNRDELFSDAYSKYLAHELRRAFGFEGCPIILLAKPRPKTITPKHDAGGTRVKSKSSERAKH